jgi:preprotein translocase subunit YajC
MEINWFIIAVVIVFALVLIYFLIRQNKKEEVKLKEELNFIKKTEEAEIDNEKES